MSAAYLYVALGYLLLGIGVSLFEYRRIRRRGADVITVFMILCVLQCCVPGVVLYGSLPFADPNSLTLTPAFDRILLANNLPTALTVLVLTAWFVIFFYGGCALGALGLAGRDAGTARGVSHELTISVWRIVAVIGGGLALTLWSFHRMGDTLLARYTNLLLFRSGFEEIERNALNANAFALTQSWSWLSVVALFGLAERRGRGLPWWVMLAISIVFAVLGASRRALFIPLLLAYLALALHTGRWRLRWVAASTVPLVIVVAYGKLVLAALSFGGTVADVTQNYQSWISALLRAAADIGITIMESVGTLALLPFELRFGVDHLLSVAQRFPEGMLGWDFNFPERIVRISTAAFADPSAQDIPPGLLGQMWLDFGALGPVVWGLALGLQMSLLQMLFDRTSRTPPSAAVFVLLTFVVALPLNSGSFDFSVSVDIIAILAALAWCVRVRPRVPVHRVAADLAVS